MTTTPIIQFPEPLAFFFETEYCRYRIAYGGRSSGKSWTAGLSSETSVKEEAIFCILVFLPFFNFFEHKITDLYHSGCFVP